MISRHIPERTGGNNRPIFGREPPYSSQKHYCWSQTVPREDLKLVRINKKEDDVRNSNNIIFLGISSLYKFKSFCLPACRVQACTTLKRFRKLHEPESFRLSVHTKLICFSKTSTV